MPDLYLEDFRFIRVVEKLLTPSSNCVDVGAHLGRMTSMFVRFSPQGQHHAFEPTPQKNDWLKKKFPEVVVHSCALGASTATVKFYLGKDSAMNSLSTRNADAKNFVKVPLRRLDDVLPQDFRVDLIKIDAEDAEVLVLQGAQRTLAKWKPRVIFEWAKRESSEPYSFLVKRGYHIYLLKDFLANKEPLPSEAEFFSAMRIPPSAINFLALPIES